MIRSGIALAKLAKSSAVVGMARRNASSSVGFVGLGRMGLPMAKNLAAAQTRIVAYDTNPVACQEATESGIQIVDSVRAIVDGTDKEDFVLITMLPGDQAFTHVMTEWQGALSNGTGNKRVVLNCSTVSPSTSKTWESTYRAAGHTVIGE